DESGGQGRDDVGNAGEGDDEAVQQSLAGASDQDEEREGERLAERGMLPRPCAALSRRASLASPAGISAEIRPPNKTIARSQARRISGSSEVNRRTDRLGDLAQERIDLLLGADVDAARRVEAEQGLEP